MDASRFRLGEAPRYSSLARISGSTGPDLVDLISSANQSVRWNVGLAAFGCLGDPARRDNLSAIMPSPPADVRFLP